MYSSNYREHTPINGSKGCSYSTLNTYHQGSYGNNRGTLGQRNYHVVPHFGGHNSYNTLQHGGTGNSCNTGHFTHARAYSSSNNCASDHSNTYSANPTQYCG
jgi:hypothetical protein